MLQALIINIVISNNILWMHDPAFHSLQFQISFTDLVAVMKPHHLQIAVIKPKVYETK